MVLTDKRRKDSEAMGSLTAAQRVQQRLNPGSPADLPEALSIPDAAVRLSNASLRLELAMCEEGLDVADSHVGLLFSNVTEAGEQIGVVWSHGGNTKVGPLITKLEALESVTILGLVWGVLDREASVGRMWARPLVCGEDVTAKMQMARNIFQLPTVIR